jgi:hypothetical protein
MALLAAVSLLGALTDLEGPWRLGIGAALGIGALGLALGQSRSGGILFVVINLLLLGPYLWAADEREALSIAFSPDGVDVRVADSEIRAGAAPLGGQVLLQAAEQIARRGTQAPIIEPLPDPPRGLLLWPQANLLSGLQLAEAGGAAYSPARAEPVWQAIQEQGEGWRIAGEIGPGAGWLRVELLRPSTMVRVLLGSAAPRGGLLVEVRPEDRHLLLAEMQDGRIIRQLAGGDFAYRPTLDGAARGLGRELGRAWLWALLLLAAAAAAGRCSGKLRLPAVPALPLVGLLSLAALGMSLFIARIVLEGIPHVTDNAAYLFQARTFALGRLWAPVPPLPEFFDHQHFIMQGERWFSKYPPGAALALLPGVLIGAPWLVSPVLAALTMVLVYQLGRQAYGFGTATLAVGLLALSPFFLFMSGSLMPHPFALFLTMVALNEAVGAGRGGHRAAAACGLALGLIAITRPLTALALTVPTGGWLVAHLGRRRGRLISVGLTMAAGAAPPLVAWLLYNWLLVGNPLANTMLAYWPFDRPGFGPEVGNLGGHDPARGLANIWANVLELDSLLYGWPVYLTLCPMLVALLGPARTRWDWWFAASALAVIGSYVFWWYPGTIHGPRYTYEAVGVLALLTARGLAVLAAGARASPGRAGLPAASLVATAGATALLLGYNLLLYLPREFASHRGYNGVDRSRLNLVERAGVRDAVVFVAQQAADWQAYSSVFPANSPSLDGPVIYAHDLGPDRDRELLSRFPGRRGYVLNGGRLRPMT